MTDYLTMPKQAEISMLLFYSLICVYFFVFWSDCVVVVFLVTALTMALAAGQRSGSAKGR